MKLSSDAGGSFASAAAAAAGAGAASDAAVSVSGHISGGACGSAGQGPPHAARPVVRLVTGCRLTHKKRG